jgi:hypothetical protein
MLLSNPFIDIDRYIPESYSEMLARYPEDEKGVLVNISELNPDLISDISFYRCNYDLSSNEYQLRDSFAYCKPSRFKPFALQLDPDLNPIIIGTLSTILSLVIGQMILLQRQLDLY